MSEYILHIPNHKLYYNNYYLELVKIIMTNYIPTLYLEYKLFQTEYLKKRYYAMKLFYLIYYFYTMYNLPYFLSQQYQISHLIIYLTIQLEAYFLYLFLLNILFHLVKKRHIHYNTLDFHYSLIHLFDYFLFLYFWFLFYLLSHNASY